MENGEESGSGIWNAGSRSRATQSGIKAGPGGPQRNGVHLFLDDVGTGYSPLAHLNDYFFDKIKIDKCFVCKLDKEPYAEAIIKAVIVIATATSIPNQLLRRKPLACNWLVLLKQTWNDCSKTGRAVVEIATELKARHSCRQPVEIMARNVKGRACRYTR